MSHSDDRTIDWDGILKAAGEIGNSAVTASPAPIQSPVDSEIETLQSQLQEEKERNRLLEMELKKLKERLSQSKSKAKTKNLQPVGLSLEVKRNLESLRLETERLKLTYPLYDLLKAKSLEIEQVEKTLAELPTDHRERPALQTIANAHKAEKEQLSFMIQKAEERFRRHLEQINDNSALLSEEENSNSRFEQVQIPEF